MLSPRGMTIILTFWILILWILSTKDFHLRSDSPAIAAGTNDEVPGGRTGS